MVLINRVGPTLAQRGRMVCITLGYAGFVGLRALDQHRNNGWQLSWPNMLNAHDFHSLQGCIKLFCLKKEWVNKTCNTSLKCVFKIQGKLREGSLIKNTENSGLSYARDEISRQYLNHVTTRHTFFFLGSANHEKTKTMSNLVNGPILHV